MTDYNPAGRRLALDSVSAAVWKRTWRDETWWKDGEDISE